MEEPQIINNDLNVKTVINHISVKEDIIERYIHSSREQKRKAVELLSSESGRKKGEKVVNLSSICHADLLAQAILELKRDEDLREGIAERGSQLVSQKFSPEAVGRTLIKILEKKLSFGEDE
jgi:glycosyltransferase involved in cell wall biosynthesis